MSGLFSLINLVSFLALLVGLSGCGASSPEETTVVPTPTTSVSPSPTPAASSSPTASPSPVVTKTTSPKPSPQKTETVNKAEPVTQTPKRRIVKEKPAEAPPKKSPSSSGAKCSDFATQAQAKAALSANPQLDRDKDGIPCESLPKG